MPSSRDISRYAPDLEPTDQESATQYCTTMSPTRPRSTYDNAKVEAAVQDVEHWTMAPLRN